MVRKTKVQRQLKIESAADYQTAWLNARYFSLNGKSLERDDFHRDIFDSPAALRAFYENTRDELALNKPGTRHDLWWQFDAPEARDESLEEAEQLDRLGLLPDGEAAALEAAAREEDRLLHRVPEHRGLPFRRSWGFWRFISPEPRDPSVFESEQLRLLDVLTSVEREILAEPERAVGRQWPTILNSRTRFYYLPESERKSLGLNIGHESFEELLQNSDGCVRSM